MQDLFTERCEGIRSLFGCLNQGDLHLLILTRRMGETLMIGSEVTVTVVWIRGNQVRLGIRAPKEVPIHREEIYERMRRENEQLE